VGVSVKKKLGSAVERNYMKRRLKEAFRVWQAEIPGHYDIWFVMRRSFSRDDAASAVESFRQTVSGYLSRGGKDAG